MYKLINFFVLCYWGMTLWGIMNLSVIFGYIFERLNTKHQFVPSELAWSIKFGIQSFSLLVMIGVLCWAYNNMVACMDHFLPKYLRRGNDR